MSTSFDWQEGLPPDEVYVRISIVAKVFGISRSEANVLLADAKGDVNAAIALRTKQGELDRQAESTAAAYRIALGIEKRG